MAFSGRLRSASWLQLDTVAEIAAPRPNWKDVAEPSSPVVPAAKQWVQTGERWRFLCLSGTGPFGWKWKEPVPSWDAISAPNERTKKVQKGRNRPMNKNSKNDTMISKLETMKVSVLVVGWQGLDM